MRNLLKKSVRFLRGDSRDDAAPAPELQRRIPAIDVEDGDIPRYPPFAKGLPATDVERVISTQGELIERIRYSLGINHPDFNRLLLPVLENYAAFVHLLPASESHHHRGAGGLFRHGLEAAFAAAQASDGVIFAIDGTPRERRDNEPRWRLVSTIAGLLHDVGKPLSDMSITNKDGTVTWNPYTEFLFDWAKRNQVDRYFLRWRDRRHKRHEQFSLLTVDRIIPAATREYIAQPGPKIMEALLEAVSGTSISNPVTKLMMFADKESVQRDLKHSRLNVDEFAYGVPVERYVFDAIRRLVNSGRWTVNEKGAKVWYLNQGVFITWKNIGDLYAIIDQDNIPGIPRDPDTLADILIERGFAVQNKVMEEGREATYRYWDVKPDDLGVSMLMLRFDSHELVFTSEPPPPAAGTVNGQRDTGGIETLPRKSDVAGQGSQDGASDVTNDYDSEAADPENEAAEAGGVGAEQAGEIQAQADSIMGGIGMDLSMFGSAPAAQSSADSQAIDGSANEAQAVDAPSEPESEPAPAQDQASPAANPLQEEPDATGKPAASNPRKNVLASSASSPATPAGPAPSADPFASIGNRLAGARHKSKPARKPAKPAPANADTVAEPHGANTPQPGKPEANPPARPAGKPDAAQVGNPAATDAVFALINVLDRYNDAAPALKTLLLPSAGSAGKKGPAKRIEGKLVIPYPEGVRLAGKTGSVVNVLADCGALVKDEQGNRIWSLGDLRCIVLAPAVQQAYDDAIERIRAGGSSTQVGTPAPTNNVPPQQTKTQPKGLPGAAREPATAKPATQGLLPMAGKTSATKSVTPKAASPENPAKAEDGAAKTQPITPAKPAQPKDAEPQAKQNTTTARAPAPKPVEHVPAKPTAKKPVPYEPAAFTQADPEAPQVVFGRQPITAERAAEMLIDMMSKGEGRWLIGPVLRSDGALRTSDEALTLIQQEQMSLSKNVMRRALRDKNGSFENKQIVIPE